MRCSNDHPLDLGVSLVLGVDWPPASAGRKRTCYSVNICLAMKWQCTLGSELVTNPTCPLAMPTARACATSLPDKPAA